MLSSPHTPSLKVQSAFGCLLPVIITWGDSSNQSLLTMYWNKHLVWIKGVSRFLFHPSKETCYYCIVSGISGNPEKCPDKFLLKIKLSSFLTPKTLLTVGFHLNGCSILSFQEELMQQIDWCWTLFSVSCIQCISPCFLLNYRSLFMIPSCCCVSVFGFG